MNAAQRLIRRLDEAQQRHAWSAFPLAVVRKFGDDQAGNLAALMAYYAFFSIFPLLLALVTVLGFVLSGHLELQRRILDSALAQFPVIGDQLKLQGLRGSVAALIVGVVGAVWSGLAVLNSTQAAMNGIWDVPRVGSPAFLPRILRGLLMLVVAGAALVLSASLAGVGTSGGSIGAVLKVLAFVGSLLVNLALFASVFKILTVADVSWRDVLPGAVVAAFVWAAMMFLGSWFVDRQIRNASQVYGVFALVIGLLSWLYLTSQMTLLAAEINVVLKRRLWPRSLVPPPVGEPDRRALSEQVQEERQLPQQEVGVRFDESPRSESSV